MDEVTSKVLKSLENTLFASSSLKQLSGGTANYIYRATLVTPLQDGTTEVLIKHGECYVKNNPQFKLTVFRCVWNASCSLNSIALSLSWPVKACRRRMPEIAFQPNSCRRDRPRRWIQIRHKDTQRLPLRRRKQHSDPRVPSSGSRSEDVRTKHVPGVYPWIIKAPMLPAREDLGNMATKVSRVVGAAARVETHRSQKPRNATAKAHDQLRMALATCRTISGHLGGSKGHFRRGQENGCSGTGRREWDSSYPWRLLDWKVSWSKLYPE